VRSICFSILLLSALARPVFAGELPANLGLGLKGLVEAEARGQTQLRADLDSARLLQADESNRVVVNVHLDGTKTRDDVAAQLRLLGLEILAVDSSWRSGVISARLPIAQAVATATLPGVQSVLLAPRSIRRAGVVAAESRVVERADFVNSPGVFTAQGILGKGISVGVVSDSFDSAPNVPRAKAGVASGDLPGTGNPDGYTQPVVVIDDNFKPNGGQTDEGRAMAEIVHDLAPAAKIAFSTVQQTQSIMAFSIRNLRANSAASCDIIVDDVFFPDEPFFSDGQLALAVEDVVNGNSLPGKKVVYFSAAGNEANNGYSSDVRLISPAQGKAAAVPPPRPGTTPPQLNWAQVPPALYAGGFHNINPGGAPAVAMPITAGADFFTYLIFQWDDPFDAKAVTTDYNLLIFDEGGNYVGDYSGTDTNVATDEPIEFALLAPGETSYVVMSLATPAPSVATHLRFVCPTGAPLSGPYIAYEAISMAGHATAASANAVGAYVYNVTPQRGPNYNFHGANPPPGPYKPEIEEFTSNGGALAFYFDAQGKRLAAPQVRLKPNFSAADGVDTTFFGGDYDNNNFPNFFGTSAAAPSAAAIAALMLEAAGGPGKLSAAQVRAKIEQTTFPHDLDPYFSQALASGGSDNVRVTAHGSSSDDSAHDPNFFSVSFNGKAGETLNELRIDLTNIGMAFDPDPAAGYPFTVGSNPNGVVVAFSLSTDRRLLTLKFANFLPGATISFGIDRDFAATGSGGNSADFLAGADIIATVNFNTTLLGAFGNQLGYGFTYADGFGLVDARGAVQSILGKRAVASGLPLNISTRAFVGSDQNVLIGGFIIQGTSKKVVVRALGPSLQSSGLLPESLPDPTLELHDANGNTIAFNNNWQDDPNKAAQVRSAGFAPLDPRESALIQTLAASNYTAIVRGANNTSGNALVEVYDVDGQTATQLANISSRGLVRFNDNVIIGGFIIGGNNPADLIVRALGPSLPDSGLTDALADPILELHDGQGNLILTNDNWQQDSDQAIKLTAAGLAPPNALESALAASLNPGPYTAVVRGAHGTTGVGLVEMYNVR